MTLAINGGTPAIKGPIKKFCTIGVEEERAIKSSLRGRVLSGFIGGAVSGGNKVCALEEAWARKFHVKHAIACNSATSGLLAACDAVGVGPGTHVITTPYTMSATAAAPKFLGANIVFADVDSYDFCINPDEVREHTDYRNTKAIIATNLFGHPAKLHELAKMGTLIEDNAQAPFASENGVFAGTIGKIGVFSLNVHKHIQCGEGGIICTNSDAYAEKMRLFINHAEMASDRLGLNLRMTEVTAAIALSQLSRADEIMYGRIRQAELLYEALHEFEWITPPKIRDGCTHVYYVWPFLIHTKTIGATRSKILAALNAEGVPLVGGYVAPLYRMRAFKDSKTLCPITEYLHSETLAYFSNCEWTLSVQQLEQLQVAFRKIEKNLSLLK